MNHLMLLAAALALTLVAGCASTQHCANCEAHHGAEGKLRHVVLFKYKESATEKDIAMIVEEFKKLPQQIDTIVDFEYGVNNSPEGLDRGYTHVFLVTFNDTAGRDVYLPHPAHKAFVDVLLPHLEEAHVMDYFAKD
ncbi:MAG: Dabb family protein [Planctomycetota bacterium]|jgi:hypothetical protein